MSQWPNISGADGVRVRDKPIIELVHSDLPFLHETEWMALTSMPNVLGYVAVASLISLPNEEVRAAVQRFVASEQEKQAQFLQLQASGLTALEKALASKSSTPPLKLDLSSYSGKEKESLVRWFVEIQTGISARRIKDDASKVAFALSHLAGPARAWGFNRLLADPDCFPTYEKFKEELAAEYEPPRTLHRSIAEFLELQQGKLTLHDYIQQMRYLISCATADPPSESIKVTHFMRGLRQGRVRDEVYRHCPDTFDQAVRIALDAEFNHRQQKFDASRGHSYQHFKAYQTPRNDGPTPMDISTIDVSKSFHSKRTNQSHQKTGGYRNNRVRRDRSNDTCHRCKKKGHWAPDCKVPRRNTSDGRSTRPASGNNVTKNVVVQ